MQSSAIPLKPRRHLHGEGPKDPIADADVTMSEDISKSVPEVIIDGLPGSKFLSPPHPNESSARGLAASQVIDSEDSIDDLSVEHYKKPRPSLSNKRQQFEPQSAPPKRDTVQVETIHDSSDEEIGTLEKGNIQSTAFPASKKIALKMEKSGQVRYQVLKVFSPKHPWFLDDPKKEWFLIYNRVGGSLSIEGEDVPPYLNMTTNSISTITYGEESSNLIIRKSSDNSFCGATNILLTLTNSNNSVKLAQELALSSTIKALPKNRFVF